MLIPQGAFEREELPDGTSTVVPGTFSFIDAGNLGFFDLVFAIPNGMVQAAPLILGGIWIGGLFAIIERTGLLDIVVQSIINVFRSKKMLVIPAIMIPIAAFFALTGALEMMLIIIPAVIPLMLKLGFDRFTGFATAMVGGIAGFTVALTAPATVGVAQSIAELPLYSGLSLRLMLIFIILSVGIWYVWRYARKVMRDPTSSYVYGDELDAEFLNHEQFRKTDWSTDFSGVWIRSDDVGASDTRVVFY
ncbi:putative ion transporter superfamily protein YfcC [Geomicrobium halophilum]|uniref:Putative ion transporter superfamily protein YfcC n=1 Tax=Geomicrobium halophilum TaxID=549000 RepID=A0A841PIQ0_9BACL|nr:SLC13 family permease [Geomicrobium halophilum]MBB6448757.1 putative ion transporter superfamily protein YfcC [Geomicrobium halophilum]